MSKISSHIVIKLVTTPEYHLWTDVLHARELAEKSNDDWNKGTYVRWCVIFAVTTLEMSCRDALENEKIGYRFKEELNELISAKGLSPIIWGSGIWQKVLKLRDERHNYIHKNFEQVDLWPPIDKADSAIDIVRKAVKDIYARASKEYPSWIDDDNERGYK